MVETKLISAFAPSVPMWEVFDLGEVSEAKPCEADILFLPCVAIAVMEEDGLRYLKYVSMDSDPCDVSATNALGWSLETVAADWLSHASVHREMKRKQKADRAGVQV